jgi:phosphoribosyl 1,2-cyclic phosphate phosphodiesterase
MGTLRVTLLGCGSSAGVPRATGDWGVCDPNEPKNRRTRCGLLLQKWRGDAGAAEDATVVLIDTPPDLRLQLAAALPHHIDAVLMSHDHADQTNGFDDLRAFVVKHRRQIPVSMDEATWASLSRRFGYAFESVGAYPAIVTHGPRLRPLTPHVVDGPHRLFQRSCLDARGKLRQAR